MQRLFFIFTMFFYLQAAQAQKLSSEAEEFFKNVFKEHESLTGEKIKIIITSESINLPIQELTQKWIQKTDESYTGDAPKELIILINPDQKDIEFVFDYELSTLFSADTISELKDKYDSSLFVVFPIQTSALVDLVFDLLKSINSPLIPSGKWDVFLQEHGPALEYQKPNIDQPASLLKLLTLICIIIFILAFFVIGDVEVQFSPEGAIRLNPLLINFWRIKQRVARKESKISSLGVVYDSW